MNISYCSADYYSIDPVSKRFHIDWRIMAFPRGNTITMKMMR